MTTIAQARQAVTDAAVRAELYRMWHAANRMGATHARSLEMMGPRHGSPRTESLRLALLKGTASGRTIEDIVKANAALLDPFEAAVLRFGEESGGLEQSLATLAAHFKAEHRLLTRVWSQMTYPMITSLAAVLIAPLPLIFQGNTGAYFVSAGAGFALWYGLGGGVITALAARYALRREFVLARLARTLASGMEAGLPLDRVVTLAADSTGHPDIIAQVRRIPVRELGTKPVSETLAGSSVIPFEMIAAIQVGEASGDFNGALRKLADLYDLR